MSRLSSAAVARSLAEPGRSVPVAVMRTALAEIQAGAGNAAASRLLQRAPLTTLEKAKNLTSARYAGDTELEAAYDNSPALRKGRRSESVKKVQQALVDDGFPMPVSTKTGSPDGIFGRETRDTVTAFQDKYGLDNDGAIGRQTMGKLDELAGGAGPKPAPPKREPEIAATEEEMGAHVAEGMKRVNAPPGPTSGVWYDYNYFAEHKKDPANYAWDDKWRQGHANPEYFEWIDWMDWRLKPGKSASEGIQAWLKGLTIAECLSAIIAVEIDTLRAAIGDEAFDERFGSALKPVPESARLRVRAGIAGTPVEGKFKQSEAATGDPGVIGKRPLKVGDWVYFYNHPKYLLKHPGGAWQGENAVYVGDNEAGQQLFSGMGADLKTEEAMIDVDMVEAYDAERDGADYVALLDTYAADKPEVTKPNRKYLDHDTPSTKALYEKYKSRIPTQYLEGSGEFEDTTTREKILNDPPYKIGDKERKGGFKPDVARRLDPKAVEPLRPAP
jgi:peptidoglycan hydrolase-like protein with peptidoglycan-binding domain